MKSFIINNDTAIATRLLSSWITQNYNFSIDKLYYIDTNTVDDIVEEEEKFDDIMKIRTGNSMHYFAYSNEVLLIITKESVTSDNEKPLAFVEIFAQDIQSYKKWYQFVKEINRKNTLNNFNIEYHSFYTNNYGILESNVEYFQKEAFENLDTVFYEPYLDVNRLFEEYLKSKSSILQLTGKPGIGKSKLVSLFIKYLFEHPEYLIYQDRLKIARVVNNEILAQDDFWVTLRQKGFNALILDDLDNILEKRTEVVNSSEDKMHNEIIKKLLSFTDGLMNNKIKILITTNVEYSKIDEALLRDMRLFDLLELRPLRHQEALDIWINHYKLDEKSFKTIFDEIEEITPAKLVAEIDKRVNNKKEVNVDKKASYLKEENISKVKSLNSRKRRIGFG